MRQSSIPAAVILAAASLTSMGAQASLVLVDNFDTPPVGQFVYDSVLDLFVVQDNTMTTAVNPAQTVFGRTVTAYLTQGDNSASGRIPAGSASNIRINQFNPPGTFAVSNSASVNAVATVSWKLPLNFIAAPISPQGEASIVFDLLYSDVMPTVVTFSYDGVTLGSLTMPTVTPITQPGLKQTFALTAAQQLAISTGSNKVLSVSISGPADWDFRMDNFGFEVPEPGTLSLVALALLGVVGLARSRKA